MQKVGALVGRFQPLHNGHVEAVRFALTKVELLYIVVGSAEKSHEIRNPFTAGERMRMIKLALDESDVDCHRVMIVPIPDADAHSVWVSYVDELLGSFHERSTFGQAIPGKRSYGTPSTISTTRYSLRD